MKIFLRALLMATLAMLVFEARASIRDPSFVVKTETIQGVIAIVQPENQLVILKTDDGTFFDFQVTPATKIEVAGVKATIENLADQLGKPVSITFRVLRTGDSALKIEVQ